MPWIDQLFTQMAAAGASDLHLTSGQAPMLRVDGDIVPIAGAPVLPPERLREVLREITPPDNDGQLEREFDTDFAYELEGCGRFRANLFFDRHGVAAVFRLIPSEILTAADLGLPPPALELCNLTKGLVVVTGPTGSGKSTTLAAMIDHVNRTRSDHIVTIEDPIEFVHRSQRCLVRQREVHRHTLSFKRALRAALREDPDVVLVGEMRDLETIEIAIETAETGHLVFGTLHTTTAASTVDRMIDPFPAERQAQIRTMLSSSLKGVIAQTLCKRVPKGRVAALEVMIANTAISANIREGKSHQIPSAMQMGGKLGMRLLNDSLAILVKEGTVEPAEAYRRAVHKEDLANRLASMGWRTDGSPIEEAADEGATAPGGAPAPGAPMPQRSAAPRAQPFSGQTGPPKTAPKAAPAPAPAYTDPFDQFKKKRSF